MINRYYIIDNFYENSYFLRDAVIASEKEKSSNGNYPGVMTEMCLFSENHQNMLSVLTNESIESGTSLNGKFRFSKKDDTFKQHIHFDVGDDLVWAGVVFLSKQEDIDKNDSGTCFWRHKETGLEEIPRTLEGIKKYGWNGVEDLKHFLETDGMDSSKWEMTMNIPAKHNRLILFRPWMFHSSKAAGFGDTLNNCRLIQTLFLKSKN